MPPIASTGERKRGNRFNGNTTVVAQQRRHTDARYAAGAYMETWLKVPKTLEWAVRPGQRFVAKVVNEGVLFTPDAEPRSASGRAIDVLVERERASA